jgi:diacylglycerol kinase family enzyme
MRVMLVHNPTAGSGHPSRAELVEALRNAGHETIYQSSNDPELERALDSDVDLALVAGGDGTVANVALRLAARDLPLAIIPIGTANNIASWLGVKGSAGEIISHLSRGTPRALDIATARGPWGTSLFVESAGVGFFASTLDGDPNADVATAVERFEDHLAGATVRPWRVEADGEDLSGEYLQVLVMNIGRIGPRVSLAPNADAGDGRLDLVLIRDEDRITLRRHREERPRLGTASLPCRSRAVDFVRVGWDPAAGHLDDSPWPDGAPEHTLADAAPPMVEMSIADPPLRVLVPEL